MTKRRTVAWLVAVAVGLTLIPTASALAADASTARTKAQQRTDRKQNQRITRVVRSVARVAANVAGVTTTVGEHTKSLADLQTLANGIDGRLKLIEAAAPQIIDGLTKLQQAALDLKAGLETAGAGLNSLKTLATSQEYGIGQAIILVGATPTPQAGSFVETPDIPDTVQQAQTSQRFKAGHIGTLIVQYAVRSNENDGTGAALPAALCKVTVTNELGVTESTAPNPAIGGLPFQPVPDKSAMTSTIPANAGFPFGLKTTAPDQDKTVTLATAVPVDNTNAANDTYEVEMACVDTSPDAANPAA
jgi:hypothetical protein